MPAELAEQDARLLQMEQDLEQLREEKAKEKTRTDKLAEEHKGEYLQVGFFAELVSLA